MSVLLFFYCSYCCFTVFQQFDLIRFFEYVNRFSPLLPQHPYNIMGCNMYMFFEDQK